MKAWPTRKDAAGDFIEPLTGMSLASFSSPFVSFFLLLFCAVTSRSLLSFLVDSETNGHSVILRHFGSEHQHQKSK